MLLVKKYKTRDIMVVILKTTPFHIVMQFLLTIFQAIIPSILMAIATARFVDTAIAIFEGDSAQSGIYPTLFFLITTVGVNSVIGSVIEFISSKITFDLERTLLPLFIEKRALLNYKHIENEKNWELVSRVADDPVSAFQNGINAYLTMLRNIITIVSILGLIVVQVWWAAIVILAFSIPLLWLSLRAGKKNYAAQVDTRKYVRKHEYYRDVLINRESVEERTLFSYGDDLIEKYTEQYEIARKKRLVVSVKQWGVVKGASMAMSMIALLIALTLINPVILGEISPGMFMGIIASVFSMINRLGWSLQSATEKISQANEYMKDLTSFVKLSQSEGALDLPDITPKEFSSLEFRNVYFKYPTGERYILNNLCFKLVAGKHYAFVGVNGAGKTTITKLLTGLYSDYEGEILINGKELRSLSASTIKALFSVVYQDFARYQITMIDNIALGDVARANSGAHISEIAKVAGLNDTINQLEEGINTPLGRIFGDGVDISGGQWQKIAIARSLASQAPIKILDEPTASLDPISESQIYKEFEGLMQGKTTIFISHRLGSTKLADEIIVFDEGNIIEHGTHKELFLKNGKYAEMFETQRGWYE